MKDVDAVNQLKDAVRQLRQAILQHSPCFGCEIPACQAMATALEDTAGLVDDDPVLAAEYRQRRVFDKICDIGCQLRVAEGWDLPDGWPDQVRTRVLEINPDAGPDIICHNVIRAIFKILGFSKVES